MTLKVFSDVGSGSCRRVNTVIQHLGLDVEYISIDLLAGENLSERFLTINPNQMVPVLIDTRENAEDFVLTEASAIMIYLCEEYGSKNASSDSLWPAGNKRFEILKWMFWAAEHFRQPAPMYFEEIVIAPLVGNEKNENRIEEANKLITKHAAILDSYLKERSYIVGNQVTLADFDLAAALSQMPRTLIPYDKYANIMKWANHLDDHASAWRNTGKELNQRMNKALDKRS